MPEWYKSIVEIEEEKRQEEIKILQRELEVIDRKSIRAIRAILSEQGTEADTGRLKELEREAWEIRGKMNGRH